MNNGTTNKDHGVEQQRYDDIIQLYSTLEERKRKTSQKLLPPAPRRHKTEWSNWAPKKSFDLSLKNPSCSVKQLRKKI